jgi:NAD(P)-dependent dehydrogenase (short-subunit alcohol dehydrogenase family)
VALAAELGQAQVVATDLGVPGAVDTVVAAAPDVDVLVNSAGVGDFGPFADTDPAKTGTMLQLNTAALTELTRAYLPGMLERGHGRVLNVASTAAFQPGPLMAVYYATKAYVLSFSEAVAEEVRGSGVTVTALCPGPDRLGVPGRGGDGGLQARQGPHAAERRSRGQGRLQSHAARRRRQGRRTRQLAAGLLGAGHAPTCHPPARAPHARAQPLNSRDSSRGKGGEATDGAGSAQPPVTDEFADLTPSKQWNPLQWRSDAHRHQRVPEP